MSSTRLDLDPSRLEAAAGWIPDLFVILWQHLQRWIHTPDDEPRRALGEEPWPSSEVTEYSELVRLIRESENAAVPLPVLQYLTAKEEYLELGACEAPFHKRPFVVARAIDEVFQALGPWAVRADAISAGLRDINQHYSQFNRFDRGGRDAPLLLPVSRRWIQRIEEGPRTSTPARLDFYFSHLVLFSPDPARPWRVEYQRAPWRVAALTPRAGPLRVGIVPLAEGKDDLVIAPADRNGSRNFTVIPGSAEPLLAERARSAVKAVAHEGAQVVVFPELTVSPSVAAAIQEALRTLPLEDAEAEPPQVVVAGSGLSPGKAAHLPYNECTVFTGEGLTAWKQCKLNAFSMQGSHLAEAIAACARSEDDDSDAAGPHPGKGALNHPVNTGVAYREHIRVGQKVVVTDGQIGRMLVLICEDLAQPDPRYCVCDALHPDWVFSPVMDTELGPRRWTARRAAEMADNFRCNVVVANSLVLAEIIPYDTWPTSGDERYMAVGLGLDGFESSRLKVAKVRMPRENGVPAVAAVFDWTPSEWSKLS